MIKEPEDEAFEAIEKAQQRRGISLNTVRHPRGAPAPEGGLNPDSLETIELELPEREPLLVDKGCAERGCMGYDSRDGDAPVEMVIQRPWVDLTRRQIQNVYFAVLEEHRGGHQMQGQLAFGEALQAAIKEKNT